MPQRLLKTRAVLALVGDVNRVTLFRWIRAGQFPPPIKISNRNFWDAERVCQAIQERARASRLQAKASRKRQRQARRDVASMLGYES